MKKKFYAYAIEGIKGITDNWEDCKNIVKNKVAKYKSFYEIEKAKEWLENGEIKLKKGLYFDAGTGAKIGVEIRVTDEKGNNLLEKIIDKNKLNTYGNYTVEEGSTNNYGELLAFYVALKLALKEEIKNIFGDSNLVIEYWSKGKINREKLPNKTLKLADEVIKLRKIFEENGGKIEHISGNLNPADLGYHK